MKTNQERLEAALKQNTVRYSRDRGEPDPTPAFPIEVVFTMAQWQAVLAALAASVDEPDGTHVGLTGKMLAYAYDVTRSDELGDWDDMAAFLNKQRAVVEPPPSIALDDLQQIARAAATNAQGESISIALNEQIVEKLTPWMKELLARAVAEPDDDALSRGTFACPVCGRDFPHSEDVHRIEAPFIPKSGLCEAHWTYDEVAYICVLEFGHEGKHDFKYR